MRSGYWYDWAGLTVQNVSSHAFGMRWFQWWRIKSQSLNTFGTNSVLPRWFANRGRANRSWNAECLVISFIANNLPYGTCLDSNNKNLGHGEANSFGLWLWAEEKNTKRVWIGKTQSHCPAPSRLGKLKVPCPLATGSMVGFRIPNWHSCPSWYVDYYLTMSG